MIHLESPPGTVPFIEVQLHLLRTLQVEGREEVAKLCIELGMGKLAQEEVWVVSLDGDRNIRAVVPVAKGGYHEVYVSVPTILSAVLLTASDRFVMVHNHPSGNLDPTDRDKSLTRAMVTASRVTDLMFEDHVIIGPPSNWLSMRSKGLLVA